MSSWQNRLLHQLMSRFTPPSVTTIEQMRSNYGAMMDWVRPPSHTQITPFTIGEMEVAWFTAPTSRSDQILLYFHGGGYCLGAYRQHSNLLGRLAQATGHTLLAVDYPLAPENPFPTAVNSALAAYRWLLSQNIPPQAIRLGGDSAGGGLVLALLIALRDQGDPLPAAAVAFSPWTDLSLSGETITAPLQPDLILRPADLRLYANVYLNGHDPGDPIASPLFADLHGLPRLLIQVGTAEILLADATRFAAKARAAGVSVTLEQWPDMAHVFPLMPFIPEANLALERVGKFLRKG